jgi:hypothetical protein
MTPEISGAGCPHETFAISSSLHRVIAFPILRPVLLVADLFHPDDGRAPGSKLIKTPHSRFLSLNWLEAAEFRVMQISRILTDAKKPARASRAG